MHFDSIAKLLQCPVDTNTYVKVCPRGGLAQWLASPTTNQGVPGSRHGQVAVRCGLEQVTFIACLVLVKPRKP